MLENVQKTNMIYYLSGNFAFNFSHQNKKRAEEIYLSQSPKVLMQTWLLVK